MISWDILLKCRVRFLSKLREEQIVVCVGFLMKNGKNELKLMRGERERDTGERELR